MAASSALKRDIGKLRMGGAGGAGGTGSFCTRDRREGVEAFREFAALFSASIAV